MDGRLRKRARRLARDQKGVTALVTAFVALVLLGFVGLAVDVVVWELDGRKLQTAADEAALAGAIASSADDNVVSAVDAVAASYGFVDGQNGVTVSVDSDYHNLKLVEVAIAQVQPQFFTRLFLAAPTVQKTAVAQPPGAPSNGTMCVMALDGTGKLAVGSATFIGNTSVLLDHCDLYNDSGASDSTDISGSSILSLQNMYLAGGYEVGGSGSLTVAGATATYVQPSRDPYAWMTIPSYSGCDQTNYSLSPNTNATLYPGVYCGGMDIKGNATLDPGTYVIDGGNFTAEAQSVITGAGVTIILTSSTGANYGTITINGGATVSLTAPTSGATQGVPGIAVWVDKNAPLASDLFNGGASQNINGAIYLPSQEVTYTGGSNQMVGNEPLTKCSQLIGLTVTFKGDSYFTHNYCSASDLPVRDPLAPPHLAS